MSSNLKIGLLGSNGKMGKQVSDLLHSEFSKKARIVAQVDMGDSIKSLQEADVVIDFSTPQGVVSFVKAMQKPYPALVTGTTGWKDSEKKLLQDYAKKAPVVMAANFSIGVLTLYEILKTAGPLLKKLGYAPAIVEGHHRHKKDKPSGTALTLQRVLESQGFDDLEVHSIRAGEIIGDHEITFYGPAEQIRISHHAQNRSLFARGAVDAAFWVCEKRKKQPQLKGVISVGQFFAQKYL